jgi:hypothetical protein
MTPERVAGPVRSSGLRVRVGGELIWDDRVMRKLLVTAGVLCSLASPALAQQPAGSWFLMNVHQGTYWCAYTPGVTVGLLCSLASPAVAQQPAGSPWSVAIQKEQPPGSWFLILPKTSGRGWVSAVFKSYEECRSAVAGPPRERTHKLLYEGTYWCTYAPH